MEGWPAIVEVQIATGKGHSSLELVDDYVGE